MTAPIFGPEDAQWSIGSEVIATWWELMGGIAVERREVGQVVAMTLGGAGPGLDWTITVSFGPLLDQLMQTKFPVDQIELFRE